MSDVSGIGILVALGYLFAIFLGIIKNAIEASKRKNNQKPIKPCRKSIKRKKEPHTEYPEDPDYPDQEDADLIEFDL
jgi:hypothetical protein